MGGSENIPKPAYVIYGWSQLVVVNIYLRSINDIDDYKMEFSVQVTFREQWNDERLKYDDVGGKYQKYEKD